jgi:phage/plasmid-like protein (TIGR03299 family)
MSTETNFAESILTGLYAGYQNPENAIQVESMLDKFGLNWQVQKTKLLLPSGFESGFYGIVRQDTQTTFTTCKEGYTPFQNSELGEMLVRLSEKTGFKIHSGGSFNGGAKVYLQLESPNKIQNLGENRTTVNGFLTGLNSHDGSTALKWGETNITICCRNTFMAALRKVKNSVRHTESIHGRVEAAINEINGIVLAEKSLFDQFIKLSEIPVKKDHIAKIVNDITGVDILITGNERAEKFTTYQLNRTNELLTSVSNEMKQKGETLWGLMSGVTHYTSHVLPVPVRENARLESVYAGSAYSVNNDSFKLIQEFAGLTGNN